MDQTVNNLEPVSDNTYRDLNIEENRKELQRNLAEVNEVIDQIPKGDATTFESNLRITEKLYNTMYDEVGGIEKMDDKIQEEVTYRVLGEIEKKLGESSSLRERKKSGGVEPQEEVSLNFADRSQHSACTKCEDKEIQIIELSARVEFLENQLSKVEASFIEASTKRGELESEKTLLKGDMSDMQSTIREFEENQAKLQRDLGEVLIEKQKLNAELITFRQKNQELINQCEELNERILRQEEKIKYGENKTLKLDEDMKRYQKVGLEDYTKNLDKKQITKPNEFLYSKGSDGQRSKPSGDERICMLLLRKTEDQSSLHFQVDGSQKAQADLNKSNQLQEIMRLLSHVATQVVTFSGNNVPKGLNTRIIMLGTFGNDSMGPSLNQSQASVEESVGRQSKQNLSPIRRLESTEDDLKDEKLKNKTHEYMRANPKHDLSVMWKRVVESGKMDDTDLDKILVAYGKWIAQSGEKSVLDKLNRKILGRLTSRK